MLLIKKMNNQEKNIIDKLTNMKNPSKDSTGILIKLSNMIEGKPFGAYSKEFINDPVLESFILNLQKEPIPHYTDISDFILLWFRIERFRNTEQQQSKEQQLKLVEETLEKAISSHRSSKAFARGTTLPPDFARADFIINIYSLNNKALSSLFLKHLPAPRAEIFEKRGIPVPQIIADREQFPQASINAFLDYKKKNLSTNLSTIVNEITGLQRAGRKMIRDRKNIKRIAWRYDITEEEAKQILADSNRPYKPKCDNTLTERIITASKNIKLFSTVRHLTASSALESIFDDALLGRRTLDQRYLSFKPAALFAYDIDEGDANVICLGANDINSGSAQDIELLFDPEKISENNPCVFYKQRDLGYSLDKIRTIKIGERKWFFNHTIIHETDGYSSFKMFADPNGNQLIAKASVKNSLLVANNLEDMHQILTLNFFRFADALQDEHGNEDVATKEMIYNALNKLDDAELAKTLQEIGKKMTDTMEFNIYGAYKIDFSALISISVKNDNANYSLHLPTFIENLKAGELEMLDEAMIKIPEVFKSQRFVAYLKSKIEDQDIVNKLTEELPTGCVPGLTRG